tara:strand:- start:62 stop:475 length:414 start_codon:yes stop_codon:yes gene_type:complete
MSEWSQIKSIEMLISRIDHSVNINGTHNDMKFFCELLNIARGRCEIVFKKQLIKNKYENNLFISSKKPIMKAVRTLNPVQYDNLIKNIYDFAGFKIKKAKIMLIIENPIAVNNQGFLNIERDLNINIVDINFSIPIF